MGCSSLGESGFFDVKCGLVRPTPSCGLALIVAQQSTEPFTTDYLARLPANLRFGCDQLITQTLMMPLGMIMTQEFNWLQVFRRADAALLGSDRRQPHQTRAVR